MTHSPQLYSMPAGALDNLVQGLADKGFEVFGPQVRDAAIVIDRLETAEALPWGVAAEQDGGVFRLDRRDDDPRAFRFVHGADSWKRLLHPQRARLWRCERHEDGSLHFEEPPPPRQMAFFGVRACDLASFGILDRVLLKAVEPDPVYAARRDGVFIIAVDCATPGGTCFCASHGTGPQAKAGYDLRITELLDDVGHRFLVDAGSERGADLIRGMALSPASAGDGEARDAQGSAAAAAMGRELDTDGLHDVLVAARESQHWQDVAERCLACTNCTMVCPTCFCTSVEDTSDLAGRTAERHVQWESCFGLIFTHLAGGSVRESGAARYRQWLTHKLGTWHDQFGSSGCVGCGRCITWCPVGIDITAEAAALRREASP